jgi:hypothetical protein
VWLGKFGNRTTHSNLFPSNNAKNPGEAWQKFEMPCQAVGEGRLRPTFFRICRLTPADWDSRQDMDHGLTFVAVNQTLKSWHVLLAKRDRFKGLREGMLDLC